MTFRTEEKLKIHPSRLPEFLEWLAENEAVIVHPPRRVISIYLDNNRLGMFHDSMEGVLPRKKLRFRRYEPRDKQTTSWHLESKISSVEGRFKTSSPSTVDPHLLQGGLPDDQYGLCRPCVEVSYLRSYFALAGVRITVDREIGYRNFSLSLQSVLSTTDPDAVVELKTVHTLSTDLLNSLFPWDRTRFSKYCRAVEATLFHGNLRTT
mgnify:FL=1|jgi:hypothetical protein